MMVKPIGGKWNYDIKNRKRLPKNYSKIPNPLVCKPDKITKRVISQLEKKYKKHFGDLEPFWFATTKEDAIKSLEDFIKNRLEFFGPYEDAMKENEKFLYHSVLSIYLNIGLLNPRDVIQKVLQNKDLPIESIEGFVRQILGWRELRKRNLLASYAKIFLKQIFFNAKNKLPDFYWTGKTKMSCMKSCIDQTKQEAYAHHIQRLMITGNFALIAGIHPKQVCNLV